LEIEMPPTPTKTSVKYQSLAPDTVNYWGSAGQIKLGKAPFGAVDGFQLTVSTPGSDSPTAFLGITVGDKTVNLSGTLQQGNVTIHTE
jgi:hypothetical protein